MDDFATLEEIKTLFESAQYINLSTIRDDGTSHPSNVRIIHGHSLSVYFLSEVNSQKSKNISSDSRVSGSMLIDAPQPGTGFNLYFNGLAHRLGKDDNFPTILGTNYQERDNAIRALCKDREDYASNLQDILNQKNNLALHRIMLTQAWYNGGIYNNGSAVESNTTRNLRIIGDKSCPLIRRYLIDAGQKTPEYATDLQHDHVKMALAA